MIQPCVAYINSLTYAEIYIVMAMLVMRFDYELFETGTEDVEFQHFFTVPHPRLEPGSVSVLVNERGGEE
jgi:hypothetical protein